MKFVTLVETLLLGVTVFAAPGPHPHHLPGQPPRSPDAQFKLCVPERAYQSCLKMVDQGKTVGVDMICVIARDRLDCIEKIENHIADWAAFDPEDMYIAAKYANDFFGVFEEIRTKEEPTHEFRYEAVSVVHKDLEISNLTQLRGLKSCHTGVGRNVGYKIPITKLTQLGVLPPLNKTDISPRENELSALSNFFSKACLVGKWSPDVETNKKWKSKYSNLCQLCEDPVKCDYPDVNSGYEGALNCLTKAGGEVAWTKVIYVKKFFGLPYGTKPAHQVDVNPDDYAYLCPDVTKRPITGPPCTWAARPWQGYMANSEILEMKGEMKELRDDIQKLNALGEETHAEWITNVLALNNLTLAVDNDGPYKPQQYLDKAKYSDVIERDVLKPTRKVRLCVKSDIEKQKCDDLSQAAFSRDIRPKLECIKKSSKEECLNAINKQEVDIMSLDPGCLKEAESKNVEPIASEVYNEDKVMQSVVAVVKKTSPYNSIKGLKGAKACLSGKGTAAGWVAPANALFSEHVTDSQCPTKALPEFFSSINEMNDPIKCLTSGQGDVAFVGSEELKEALANPEDFNKEDYEIINLKSNRCNINQADQCSFAKIPARVIVAGKNIPQVVKDDILFTILSAGSVFGKDPHLFSLFGSYKTNQHVLFSNYANGFVNNENAAAVQQEFKSSMLTYSC